MSDDLVGRCAAVVAPAPVPWSAVLAGRAARAVTGHGTVRGRVVGGSGA